MSVQTLSNNSRVVLKKRVINLRKRGYSYALINSKTNVPNGTLSGWLKDIPYSPNRIVLKRIQDAPAKSAKILMARRIENEKRARRTAYKELGKITKRDIWMIGVGLYIGEGAKNKSHMVRIMNSDPQVIRLAISWLRSVCGLDMNNFHIAIHTYPDLDLEKTLNFWSKTTGIPRSQFGKTQIDMRTNKLAKNKGKSLFGTAHVTVRSKKRNEYGVFLFRRIMGWIESVEDQIDMRV